MMKYVFALLVLLQICNSVQLNTTLNGEIIKKLKLLGKLHRDGKLNITSQGSLPLTRNVYCLGDFVTGLKHFLTGVTVHDEDQHTIEELQGNLEKLGQHVEDNNCQMSNCRRRPFETYTQFLREVNHSHRRR